MSEPARGTPPGPVPSPVSRSVDPSPVALSGNCLRGRQSAASPVRIAGEPAGRRLQQTPEQPPAELPPLGPSFILRATRLVLRCLGALPLTVAQDVGRAIGLVADLLPLGIARTTDRNLRICFPALDRPQRRALARRSLAETGALAAELGLVWLAGPPRALTHLRRADGVELLDRATRRGRGVLLLVPHLGNWELLNLWLAARGPFTALFAPARDPSLGEWIRHCRERSGARLVPTDAAGLRILLRALRSGETVAILPDQVPLRAGGVYAPFFGADALTMTLVGRLLRSSGATPLMGCALRIPGGFSLHFSDPEAGLADPDPTVAARALNASIEPLVRAAPAQYQWDYKRFKHPPPGREDPYRGARRQRPRQ
mgnify:CR=1 FL=1